MFELDITPTPFEALSPKDAAPEAVRLLQEFLAYAGYAKGLEEERKSGKFGAATKKALARMQVEQLRVTSSGELDAPTRIQIIDFMHRQVMKNRPDGFYAAVSLLFEEFGHGGVVSLRAAQAQSIKELKESLTPADAEETRRIQNVLRHRGFDLGGKNETIDAGLQIYQMELGLDPVGFVNGHVDRVTASFLQIDDDERVRQGVTPPTGMPEMQYVKPYNPLIPPGANMLPEGENRLELLKQLLAEITAHPVPKR